MILTFRQRRTQSKLNSLKLLTLHHVQFGKKIEELNFTKINILYKVINAIFKCITHVK